MWLYVKGIGHTIFYHSIVWKGDTLAKLAKKLVENSRGENMLCGFSSFTIGFTYDIGGTF